MNTKRKTLKMPVRYLMNLVLSVASLADILFNAVFGSLVDAIGYRTSFLIMPACMVGCTALLWLFFAKAKKLERCD